MTPEELQGYRDWSARKMGWVIYSYRSTFGGDIDQYYWDSNNHPTVPVESWLPDNPSTGQIWMLVERMRELGWTWDMATQLDYETKPPSFVCYESGFRLLEGGGWIVSYDPNPCLAILLAAKTAED